MFRVMIADDEPSARLGIRECLKWAELGCELVSEAENGRDALQLLEKEPVDIVITDVKMPHMDGIELSKEIVRQYPNIKIILISGYSEVEYLKNALKVSAIDYILKPIDLTDLEEAIKKAVQALKDAADSAQMMRQMEKKLHKSMPLLKQKFLMTFIRDDVQSSEALENQMRDLDIWFPLDKESAIVLVSLEQMGDNMPESDYQLLSFGVLNICQEVLEQYYNGYCIESGRGEFVCLISFEDRDKSGLKQMAEKIRQGLHIWLKMDVTLCVSPIADSISDLKKCYLSAVCALDRKLMLGKNQIIIAEETEGAYYLNGIFDLDMMQEISDCIRLGDYVKTKKLTEKFFVDLRKVQTVSPDYVRSICLMLLLLSNRIAAEEAPDAAAFLPDSREHHAALCGTETLDEMQEYLLKIFCLICEHITQAEGQGNIVNEVKKYIKENFAQNITIKELADEVYLSHTYLSYLFKQKTGNTINDYITSVRMEHAKKLLKNRKNSMTDIAHAVGYQEASYFTKVFKKYTGKMPSEYR